MCQQCVSVSLTNGLLVVRSAVLCAAVAEEQGVALEGGANMREGVARNRDSKEVFILTFWYRREKREGGTKYRQTRAPSRALESGSPTRRRHRPKQGEGAGDAGCRAPNSQP